MFCEGVEEGGAEDEGGLVGAVVEDGGASDALFVFDADVGFGLVGVVFYDVADLESVL